MDRLDRGFCYAASCEGYLVEALRSIASLKAQMPDADVTIVAPSALFRSDERVSNWVAPIHQRAGPIFKSNARAAPYERVIFLDTDTFVAGCLDDAFNVLDSVDLAFCAEVHRLPQYGAAHRVPQAFPEANTGFLAFRNAPSVNDLFAAWEDEYDRLHSAQGVANDQPAFRNALWTNRAVRHTVLDREYNLIGGAPGTVTGQVRVLHYRCADPAPLVAGLNRSQDPRAFVPGWGVIRPPRGRGDGMDQFRKLASAFVRMLFGSSALRELPTPVKWWNDAID